MIRRLTLFAFILSVALPAQTLTPPPGSGSLGDPYRISTLDHLYWLSQTSTAWNNKYFELQNDIDAAATATWDGGAGFDPIGNSTTRFQSSFEGNGYVISNLTIDRPTEDNVGLFGLVNGSPQFKNIHLFNASVTGAYFTGGLLGYSEYGSTSIIDSCSVSGNISGVYYVGGLVGSTYGTVSNSMSSGTVFGSSGNIGGFVGFSAGDFEQCFTTSDVSCSGIGDLGGFIGQFSSLGTISDCYSTGNVDGGGNTGGFAGSSRGAMSRTYSKGFVSGGFYNLGGLIGSRTQGTVLDCFWDIETSGQTTSAAGNGQTSENLKKQSTYGNWNFTSIWMIEEDLSYPALQWLGGIPGPPTTVTSLATSITASSASLRGEITPNGQITSYYFEWGTTSGVYSESSAPVAVGSGFIPLSVSHTATSLISNSQYFFRIVADNGTQTVYGEEQSFYTMPQSTAPSGSGTSGDPYLIASLENLYWLMQNSAIWNDNLYFRQVADIDLSTSQAWDGGLGFLPIGENTNVFNGSYNGAHFMISGLTIRRNQTYVGFFGYANQANIDSVILVDAFIESEGLYTGGLAGYASASTINDCSGSGQVNGRTRTGGLFGWNAASSFVNRCSFSGLVYSGGSHAGLLSGASSGFISHCFTNGSANGDIVGGLVGINFSGTISNSYSNATVTGGDVAGGLLGENNATGTPVLSNCFSVGIVSGSSITGGLVGQNNHNPGTTVSASYWDTETSGQLGSAGGEGKTTIMMRQQTTFSGWNFISDWFIIENVSYPGLQWQGGEVAPPMVRILTASTVTASSATLNSGITPNGLETDYYFQYGLSSGIYTTNGPTETLIASYLELPVSLIITGLSKNTRYYYRVFARNDEGTAYSDEMDFYTPPQAVAPAGSGTAQDPYQLSSVDHLAWLVITSSAWSSEFILLNTIDATATSTWYGQQGFRPIGTSGAPFTGVFHGKGHSIDKLFINRPNSGNIGFFGVADNALVDSLHIRDADISGNTRVGILVGQLQNSASLQNCSANGTVDGYEYIGGLIGYMDTNASAENCFSSGSVSISYYRGAGFVGYLNDGQIDDSYSHCSVSGNGSIKGGFVSQNQDGVINRSYSTGAINGPAGKGFAYYNNGNIVNCYWDTQTSGTTSSIGGTGKITTQMQQEATFVNWDFTPSTGAWFIDEGNSYPLLQWQVPVVSGAPGVLTLSADSVAYATVVFRGRVNPNLEATDYYFEYGTSPGNYSLFTATKSTQTNYLEEDVRISGTGLNAQTEYFYRLLATNSNGTVYGNENSFITTIGPEAPLAGDGSSGSPWQLENFKHLYWLSLNSANWGDFFIVAASIDASPSAIINQGNGLAPIGNSSTAFSGEFNGNKKQIANLFIDAGEDARVGLFGNLSGAVITDIGLTNAQIAGGQYTGALAGYGDAATTIARCYSSGSVNGSNNVGGLVGWLDNSSTIENCYSQAAVTAENTAGGLVGFSVSSKIDSSYSIGRVISPLNGGGLVGKTFAGQTRVSYWNTETSGQSASAAGQGKVTIQLKQAVTYSGWSFGDVWRIINRYSYPDFADSDLFVRDLGSSELELRFAGVALGEYDISIDYFNQDTPFGNPPPGINNVSRYSWEISGTETLGASSVHASVIATNVQGVVTPENIRWLQREENTLGTDWDEISTDVTNGVISTVVSLNQYAGGLGALAIGSTTADNSLPVALGIFTANGGPGQVTLQWVTESEVDNLGFTIFRRHGEDAYSEVASYRNDDDLRGLGTTAAGQTYTYVDNDPGLVAGDTYLYRLTSTDRSGQVHYHPEVEAVPELIAYTFEVRQNYPNPFNPRTTIEITVAELIDQATVEVYDILGRKIKTLFDGQVQQHRLRLLWEGDNEHGNRVGSGVYFYRYRSATHNVVRKMMLLR
jgi:hypothetical protein